MSGFGIDGFAEVRPVRVELFTSGYRIAGTIHTRFTRVAEILNQLSATHLPVQNATVAQLGVGEAVEEQEAIVAVDEILIMLAPDLARAPGGDMRVPKEPVHAVLAIPPLVVAGQVHVPIGSRPMDGLLNVPDRFLPMTAVSVTSEVHPSLDRTTSVIAVRRDRAHVIRFPTAAPTGAEPQTEG